MQHNTFLSNCDFQLLPRSQADASQYSPVERRTPPHVGAGELRNESLTPPRSREGQILANSHLTPRGTRLATVPERNSSASAGNSNSSSGGGEKQKAEKFPRNSSSSLLAQVVGQSEITQVSTALERIASASGGRGGLAHASGAPASAIENMMAKAQQAQRDTLQVQAEAEEAAQLQAHQAQQQHEEEHVITNARSKECDSILSSASALSASSTGNTNARYTHADERNTVLSSFAPSVFRAPSEDRGPHG